MNPPERPKGGFRGAQRDSNPADGRVQKILFFAEAVTLAHVARPIALARGLDVSRIETIVACHPRYERFLRGEAFRTVPLDSADSALFVERLARGSPVFDAATLRRYVRDDLALIERLQPDLVVGDFRLSLSVSARLAGIPYAAVTNAYWSPHAIDQRLPLPVLPMTRLLPLAAARALFKFAQPLALRAHCAPLNTLRRENGLATLGDDLRSIYTDADHVLYADSPALFPMRELPPAHRFIGPVAWSPTVQKPPWWSELPAAGQRPTIYLTLGSSGAPQVFERVLGALAQLPVTVLASTAGFAVRNPRAENVWLADYLPGDEAAAKSNLVVGNGGSMVCHQAASAGVPVVGIASNMDQFLNMAGVLRAGVGLLLRADRIGAVALCQATLRALADDEMRRKAVKLGAAAAGVTIFARFVDSLFWPDHFPT